MLKIMPFDQPCLSITPSNVMHVFFPLRMLKVSMEAIHARLQCHTAVYITNVTGCFGKVFYFGNFVNFSSLQIEFNVCTLSTQIAKYKLCQHQMRAV